MYDHGRRPLRVIEDVEVLGFSSLVAMGVVTTCVPPPSAVDVESSAVAEAWTGRSRDQLLRILQGIYSRPSPV